MSDIPAQQQTKIQSICAEALDWLKENPTMSSEEFAAAMKPKVADLPTEEAYRLLDYLTYFVFILWHKQNRQNASSNQIIAAHVRKMKGGK
jgi:hypothetical protein